MYLQTKKTLTQLFRIDNPGSRITHWKFVLAESDYTIHYKAGKRNQNADFLSRKTVNTILIAQKDKQKELIKQYNESGVVGHQEIQRTYNALSQYVTWPGMYHDVASYIQICPICQKWETITEKMSTGVLLTDTPPVPWVKLDLDLVCSLDQTGK